MNPCVGCIFDDQGCHESGFAIDKCQLWTAWATELAIFKAECRQRTRETHKHLQEGK